MREEPQQQSEAFVDRPVEEPVRRGGKNTIRLKTDSNGNIDWSQVSEDQHAAVIAGILNDPEALKAFKAILSESGVQGEFGLEDAQMCLGLILLIESSAFIKGGIDKDIVTSVCQYDENQHKLLDPRIAKLLNKWLSGDFPYKDEVMAAGLISFIGLQHYHQAQSLMKQKHGQTIDGVVTAASGVQPVNGEEVKR